MCNVSPLCKKCIPSDVFKMSSWIRNPGDSLSDCLSIDYELGYCPSRKSCPRDKVWILWDYIEKLIKKEVTLMQNFCGIRNGQKPPKLSVHKVWERKRNNLI